MSDFGNSLWDILIIAGVVLASLFIIGMIFARLFTKATKELAFVRTGLGGQKVIKDGGSIVLPVLHEVMRVNMNTLRLEVQRNAEAALITQDRMRVDVLAEFYVRVRPTEESIGKAAQTLGTRTLNPTSLSGLVEGKFVDALRAVAAEMSMEDLHEQRVHFVQKVQQAVTEDLSKNGLELESVSLTGLDQTNREYFNPDNVFDAEGLTKMTQAIEDRKKRRNEIEQDTKIAIERKDLTAAQQSLEIAREQEYARMSQEREIAVRRAEQKAAVAAEEAGKKQEAEQAQIIAQREIDQAQITAERAVEEERIAKEQQIEQQSIAKTQAVESAAVQKRKAVALAEQEREIAIAEKSKEESLARAEADRARADAVKAEEEVKTVRETAHAERQKAIELVEANKEAERAAISVKVGAEAEKQAAEDQAEAARLLAQGEADKARIQAQAQADAIRAQAEAEERRYQVDAEGKRALNEAANILNDEQISLQTKLALLEHLPGIIAESVKPMEQIDGIKIMQVDGLNGGANSAAGGSGTDGAASNGNLADQVVSSALRYRAQAPLVESLLQEVGLSGTDLNGLTAGLQESPTQKPSE